MSLLKPKGYVRTPKLGAVKLYSKIVFGSSGAIASQTAEGSSGFVATLSATGLYDITTTDKWASLLFVSGIIFNAATAKGQHVELNDKYEATTTKVFSLNIVSDAGAAEAPTSGDELWLEVTLANTTVGP